MRLLLVAVLAPTVTFAGCSSSDDAAATKSREELLNPSTCGQCHVDHFREWSGSMHAYASEDPIFLAMNKRLQRETNNQLGDFCVKCHAPMAVRDGKTKDGLNLADLPPSYRGVTCFFCHTAESVGELHNNGLIPSADPTTMRGAIADPVKNSAHRSTRSNFHDGTQLDSAKMCGSCHDIMTTGGAHVERTFAEWQQSLFATEKGLSCGSCHMKASAGLQPIANVPGVFARTAHSHTFAGVDRALTPFPSMPEQKEEIQNLLDSSIQSALCVSRRGPSSQIRVVLDNVFAGHAFPSGASADRRVWVEVVAKNGDQVVYQTGVFADQTPVVEGPADKDLWLLRDLVFDGSKKETHEFGLATCYETRTLPFPVTSNPADPRFYQRNIVRDFPSGDGLVPSFETATLRVRILPVGFEVIDDLIASGDLDPAVRSQMEPMQVGPTVEWKAGASKPFVETQTGAVYECTTATNQNYQANKFPPTITNTCGP